MGDKMVRKVAAMNNFKWSKILSVVGLFLGGLSSFNNGVTYPTEVLGYSSPYVLLFLFLGFIVDFFASKIKK